MPFIKRYPDGSVFDYTNGHRTADAVAREKEAGTYSEPKEETATSGLATGIIAGVTILLSAFVWLGVTAHIHNQQNLEYTKSELASASGGTVLDGGNKDQILLRMNNDEGIATIACGVSKFVEKDKSYAAVFCTTGMPADLVVELPYK